MEKSVMSETEKALMAYQPATILMCGGVKQSDQMDL